MKEKQKFYRCHVVRDGALYMISFRADGVQLAYDHALTLARNFGGQLVKRSLAYVGGREPADDFGEFKEVA